MPAESKPHPDDPEVGEQLEFHYQKSPHYRTIYCDGVHGGATARGKLALTLYNERVAIPRRSHREIVEVQDEAIRLGDETIDDGLRGIVRQLEVTTFMDLDAARSLHRWLGDKIADLEKMSDSRQKK